ncbi:hypothetical protein ONS96_008687 [Cadophora gregata f. sp. sojae]|nr:hypothetical protein ONS96_008687 [Cadophora gregata f. sp. sojae]
MASQLSFNCDSASQGTVYDILCDACEDFLGRPEVAVSSMVTRTRAYHWPPGHNVPAAKIHSTFANMKTSSQNGCHMCTLILASFGSQDDCTIPDTCLILAKLWRFPDSMGQNMASVAVWPTGVRDNSDLNGFFRKFFISHLNIREKNNILARRARSSTKIGTRPLSQVKSWLVACCKYHSTCKNSWTLVSEQRKMPTRLLEIAQSSGDWKLRIIYGSRIPIDSEYATLSHCWGTSNLIRLTSENHHVYTDNLPFECLPRTFQDAVELTFSLGLRFLWIDSICIIQNSKDDWISESSMMGSVYAQGYLNIAATYSHSGDGGLFNQSSSLSGSPCTIRMTDSDDSISEAIFYQDSVWEREVENAPLGKRAWVVQERILAPRVVHFSSNQILWECCQERAAELLPADAVNEDGELKKVAPYPATNEAQDPDRIWVHRNWASLVEKYSSCSLTVQSDKLVAISGLARRVCGQLGLTPQDYIAGLWKSNLIYGLLYRVERDSAIIPSRFSDRAPSWSWASVYGVITFFPQDYGNLAQWPYTTVVSAHIDHNGDPYGQLKGGSIQLRGPLSEIPLDTSLSEMPKRSADEESSTFTASASDIFLDESNSERVARLNRIYFLLLIAEFNFDEPAEVHGLLLCPTGLKKGQFERIGVLLYGQAGNFDFSLKNAKDPAKLDEKLYLDADTEKGFTIEIT